MSEIQDSPAIEAATEVLVAAATRTIASVVSAWEGSGVLTPDEAVRVIENFESEWCETIEYPPAPAEDETDLVLPPILTRSKS